MTLTVLSDAQVQQTFEALTTEQLASFRKTLSEALHDFSTSVQAGPGGPYLQPPGLSTSHPTTDTMSLYAAICGPEGMGSKGTYKIKRLMMGNTY